MHPSSIRHQIRCILHAYIYTIYPHTHTILPVLLASLEEERPSNGPPLAPAASHYARLVAGDGQNLSVSPAAAAAAAAPRCIGWLARNSTAEPAALDTRHPWTRCSSEL